MLICVISESVVMLVILLGIQVLRQRLCWKVYTVIMIVPAMNKHLHGALVFNLVPNIPRVEIVPDYSSDSQALERLFIVTTVNQLNGKWSEMNIFNAIIEHPHVKLNSWLQYRKISSTLVAISLGPQQAILLMDPTLSVVVTSFNSTVSMASCEEGSECPVELPSGSYCPQSTAINVIISAANKLGEGPRSSPFMIGIKLIPYSQAELLCMVHIQ